MHALDMARFTAFYDVKLVEAATFVFAGVQFHIGNGYIVEAVCPILLRACFPADTLATLPKRFVKVVVGKYSFKSSAFGKCLLSFLFSFRFSALVSRFFPFYTCHNFIGASPRLPGIVARKQLQLVH